MSNYKILQLASSVPDKTLTDFYISNNLHELSYENICQAYRDKGLLIPANWSVCMRQLGNESIDVIPHHLILQKHWCEENGTSFDENSESIVTDILDEQIARIRPDVIFFFAGAILSVLSSNGSESDYIAHLKTKFPFLKIVSLYWGDYRGNNWYKSLNNIVDIVFVSNDDYRKKMLFAGIKAYEIHSSFDHILYNQLKIKEVGLEHDFVFAGATGYLCGLHIQRYESLKYLLKNTELQCWATERQVISPNNNIITSINYNVRKALREIAIGGMINVDTEYLNKFKNLLSNKNNFTIISRLIDYAIDSKNGTEEYRPVPFPHNYKPLSTMYPSKVINGFIPDFYGLMASSKVIFNAHRDEPADYSNIRIFEATGVGSCLITDKPDKVKQYFVPDEEILTYSNMDECVEKVNYVLENETVRKEIARKGQLRTMRNYTTMHHSEKIHEVLKSKI